MSTTHVPCLRTEQSHAAILCKVRAVEERAWMQSTVGSAGSPNYWKRVDERIVRSTSFKIWEFPEQRNDELQTQ